MHFPQLSTGSIAQFPFANEIRLRSVTNHMLDGRVVSWADADAAQILWRMRFQHLADAELSALQSLFSEAGGRLKTFLFPDPAGNLIRWSSDLTKSVWDLDPMCSVTPGAESHTLSNAGAVAGGLSQPVSAPSAYTLCWSAQARASSPQSVTFEIRADGSAISRTFQLSNEWRNCEVAGQLGGSGESVTVAIVLPAGGSIEVRHPQFEAQRTASGYKATFSRGGAYSETRFDSDRLAHTTHGPNDHSVEIRLISRIGGQQ